jgi:hypothetical protein
VALLAGAAFWLTGDAVCQAQTNIARWHSNLKEGVQLAHDTGKPLMVVFRCVR